MTWISVDVEADGPAPGLFSMIAIGAVVVADHNQTFLGYLRPLPDADWQADALAVSGFTRDEVLAFPEPAVTMLAFIKWVTQFERPIFVADNNGFDWSFVNYYLWRYCHENPFGFSSKNINNLFHGMKGDTRASFKGLRKTKHDHNPVNDAKGNAEALIYMRDEMGLKVRF